LAPRRGKTAAIASLSEQLPLRKARVAAFAWHTVFERWRHWGNFPLSMLPYIAGVH
jgi:hypothetical protein